MADHVDTLVVGAGVVGLAVAREFARRGREVLVVDAAHAIGSGTSSRNSEVVHAGIYYPPGSLKARLCVEGKTLLYSFCEASGVEARAIGKLVVAQTDGEVAKLETLMTNAKSCGVSDLRLLTAAEVREIEPALRCVAALLSPSTGIVDSHGLMLALLADAEQHGATLALRARVTAGTVANDGLAVSLALEDGAVMALTCGTLVNCAGHGAHQVVRALEGYDGKHLPPRFLAKGSYCSVSGRSPFSHLVYPVPVPGALGTHLTIDMQGQARLGPNIEWVDREDYSLSPAIAHEFTAACKGYWPGVVNRELAPSYSGIRPKISGPGEAAADFLVQGPKDHGVAGLVNLFGIESPGLTSSLALARHIWDCVA